MASIPIIVCGRNPKIAARVRQTLLPEYDVIHIILTPEAGAKDIPLLLSGKTPPETSSNHGSQNYTQPPIAVAVGGGFDNDTFNQMKDACKDIKETVWVRSQLNVEGGMPPLSDTEAFGARIGERIKAKFGELGVGTEEGTKEGLFWF
ncbi:hypothetical protein P153DRAFT_367553 [Dothidotthia symphoricarpi CBS 119687]|uniref:Uncharacterized protein n=1 Tax=Dothidotthia symphoricarpi CBS 119687 TaxID=1392245 RepID=A0A6A6A8W7_9PLEO|nr:uncharacterized protein P153DRAFT_367553 [Dothidotthia symphoricarpi CBS 119687]KAF2128402.1 hypothetical protein P153DRAFT_367553 [Dothidotthia symphoricarpi CBS 119687]